MDGSIPSSSERGTRSVPTLSLLFARRPPKGENGLYFGIEEISAIHAASRALDKQLRSLLHLRVAQIEIGELGVTLHIAPVGRKHGGPQDEIDPEEIESAIRRSTAEVLLFQERRAKEVASSRAHNGEAMVTPEPNGDLPRFALEPVDAANRALSRVQGVVVPALLASDGKTPKRRLTLPSRAALVPPRKPKSLGVLSGISGRLTGTHGSSDENAIVDDQVSIPMNAADRVERGATMSCDDDLIPWGRPIVRYRRQCRLPTG